MTRVAVEELFLKPKIPYQREAEFRFLVGVEHEPSSALFLNFKESEVDACCRF